MQKTSELLSELWSRGFKLTAAGDRLRVEPASKLTPDLREAIKANKGPLMELVKTAPCGDQKATPWPSGTPSQKRASATLAAHKPPSTEPWNQPESDQLLASLKAWVTKKRPNPDKTWKRALATCWEIVDEAYAARDMIEFKGACRFLWDVAAEMPGLGSVPGEEHATGVDLLPGHPTKSQRTQHD